MDHSNDPMGRVSERVVCWDTLMVTCCSEHVGNKLRESLGLRGPRLRHDGPTKEGSEVSNGTRRLFNYRTETHERVNQQRARNLCSSASQNATRAVCDVFYWSDRCYVVTSTLPLLGNHAYNVAGGVRRTPRNSGIASKCGVPGTPHLGSRTLQTPRINLNFSVRKAKTTVDYSHKHTIQYNTTYCILYSLRPYSRVNAFSCFYYNSPLSCLGIR